MNKVFRVVVLFLALALPGLRAADERAFVWLGEPGVFGAEGEEKASVSVEKGTLGGPGGELVFPGESGKGAGKAFVEVEAMGKGLYEELTVACFLLPLQVNRREEIFSCLREEGKGGFRLVSSWGVWRLIVGDGSDRQTLAVRREAPAEHLKRRRWQHVAAVFDKGKVKLYKNGVLVAHDQLDVLQISIDHPHVRIGAQAGRIPPVAHPFAGRMTGIYLAAKALSGEEIGQLMERSFQ
ncbi:MAG TPA: LamG-like jellyroll fold domain-containing protein [Chthoniobacteraceae bacterium]|nr:LamG-like jellyroll fold domain-containing protein [Chthoniobacteraceae bacterium]